MSLTSDGHEAVLRYYKTRPANAHVMAQGSMQCRGMEVSDDAGMSFSGKLFCFHVTAAYSSEAQGRDSFKDHDDAKHRIVCGCDSEEERTRWVMNLRQAAKGLKPSAMQDQRSQGDARVDHRALLPTSSPSSLGNHDQLLTGSMARKAEHSNAVGRDWPALPASQCQGGADLDQVMRLLVRIENTLNPVVADVSSVKRIVHDALGMQQQQQYRQESDAQTDSQNPHQQCNAHLVRHHAVLQTEMESKQYLHPEPRPGDQFHPHPNGEGQIPPAMSGQQWQHRQRQDLTHPLPHQQPNLQPHAHPGQPLPDKTALPPRQQNLDHQACEVITSDYHQHHQHHQHHQRQPPPHPQHQLLQLQQLEVEIRQAPDEVSRHRLTIELMQLQSRIHASPPQPHPLSLQPIPEAPQGSMGVESSHEDQVVMPHHHDMPTQARTPVPVPKLWQPDAGQTPRELLPGGRSIAAAAKRTTGSFGAQGDGAGHSSDTLSTERIRSVPLTTLETRGVVHETALTPRGLPSGAGAAGNWVVERVASQDPESQQCDEARLRHKQHPDAHPMGNVSVSASGDASGASFENANDAFPRIDAGHTTMTPQSNSFASGPQYGADESPLDASRLSVLTGVNSSSSTISPADVHVESFLARVHSQDMLGQSRAPSIPSLPMSPRNGVVRFQSMTPPLQESPLVSNTDDDPSPASLRWPPPLPPPCWYPGDATPWYIPISTAVSTGTCPSPVLTPRGINGKVLVPPNAPENTPRNTPGPGADGIIGIDLQEPWSVRKKKTFDPKVLQHQVEQLLQREQEHQMQQQAYDFLTPPPQAWPSPPPPPQQQQDGVQQQVVIQDKTWQQPIASQESQQPYDLVQSPRQFMTPLTPGSASLQQQHNGVQSPRQPLTPRSPSLRQQLGIVSSASPRERAAHRGETAGFSSPLDSMPSQPTKDAGEQDRVEQLQAQEHAHTPQEGQPRSDTPQQQASNASPGGTPAGMISTPQETLKKPAPAALTRRRPGGQGADTGLAPAAHAKDAWLMSKLQQLSESAGGGDLSLGNAATDKGSVMGRGVGGGRSRAAAPSHGHEQPLGVGVHQEPRTHAAADQLAQPSPNLAHSTDGPRPPRSEASGSRESTPGHPAQVVPKLSFENVRNMFGGPVVPEGKMRQDKSQAPTQGSRVPTAAPAAAPGAPGSTELADRHLHRVEPSAVALPPVSPMPPAKVTGRGMRPRGRGKGSESGPILAESGAEEATLGASPVC